jgi:hypothetical protein
MGMPAPLLARTLSYAAALSGLAALTGGVLLHRNIDAWDSMRAQASVIEGELAEVSFERDVLWGEIEEGSAMDSYRSAAELVEVERLGYSNLGPLMEVLEGPFDSGALRRLLESAPVQEAFALIRKGAHQLDATPVGYPNLDDFARPRLVTGRTLVLLVRAHAQNRAAIGRDLDAARWMLDAAQMGVDYARAPLTIDRAIGTTLARIALQGSNWEEKDLSFLGDEGLHEIRTVIPKLQEEIRLLPWAGAADFVNFVDALSEQMPDPWSEPFSALTSYGRSAQLGSEFHSVLSELDEAWAISADETQRVSDRLCERFDSPGIRHAARSIRSVRALEVDLLGFLDEL